MSRTGQRDISKEVIEGCSAGDNSCQKIVYEAYYKSMYAVCLRYSGNSDEAKDLLQDGFLKLFKKVKSFNGDSNFKTWATRLFINHCIDYLRSAYKKYVHYVDQVYSNELDTSYEEPILQTNPNQETVFKAMNKLRADYRLIINLFAIENLNHSEIAERLNIKEASSRSKLSRARVALKKELRIE